LWYEVVRTTVGDRAMDYPAVPIEKAGEEVLKDYYNQPDENKYIVRLNFTAQIWRDIDTSIRDLIENLSTNVAIKKKSPFDF
jgi:hypothetical protein